MAGLSSTQIASAALVLLGQNPIADITDTSVPNAVKANAQYDLQRQALLREYDWNFARGREQLQPSATNPAFGWQFAFPVPADFLRALVVNKNLWPWKLEGNTILTNGCGGGTNPPSGPDFQTETVTVVCNLVYVRDITQTGLFDPIFTNLLSIRLAAVLAYPILKDASKSKLMWSLYDDAKGDAKRVSASEETIKHIEPGHNATWDRIRGQGDWRGRDWGW